VLVGIIDMAFLQPSAIPGSPQVGEDDESFIADGEAFFIPSGIISSMDEDDELDGAVQHSALFNAWSSQPSTYGASGHSNYMASWSPLGWQPPPPSQQQEAQSLDPIALPTSVSAPMMGSSSAAHQRLGSTQPLAQSVLTRTDYTDRTQQASFASRSSSQPSVDRSYMYVHIYIYIYIYISLSLSLSLSLFDAFRY
jgi:hypothetical protein